MLPIYDVSEYLLSALQSSPQVLLLAPTGAGKSTGLPLIILKSGVIKGRIIMLEPRRIAARTVAMRLAEQLGEEVGQTIGLRMRSDSRTSQHTRIEVVTEGVLTRLLQNDPMLEDIGLIILDEFHERSLQADLGLALLLDVQQALRDDLKILLMSATLDNQRLNALFPDAPVIISEGRSYPVTRYFHPINPHQLFHKAVASAVVKLLSQEKGSLLLFLPGVSEIEKIRAELAEMVSEDILLCPLYGALSIKEQQQAIQPAPVGKRKVVLATNIAETSLTIEGIRLVVDSGFERVGAFNPKSGLTKLVKQRISQASMVQRAGRAGRLEEGVCWHLFSQEQAQRAAQYSEAEILQSDLSSLWLSLLQWGCQDVSQLQWIDVPPQPAVMSAKKLLVRLGATDQQGQLTVTGRGMAETGSSVRTAAILQKAQQYKNRDAIKLAALLVAILEEPPRKGYCDLRYHLDKLTPSWCKRASLLCGFNITGRTIHNVVDQPDHLISEWLLTFLSAGFPDRIAKNRDNHCRYQLSNGLGAELNETDNWAGTAWLIAPELWQPELSADAKITLALPFEIAELQDYCPELFSQQETIEWDEQRGTLIAWRRTQCDQLVVQSERLSNPDKKQIKQALLHWLRQNGLASLDWSERTEQLRVRCQLAQQWFPEISLPHTDDDSLLDTLELWLAPYLDGITHRHQLQSINLTELLTHRLSWEQSHWLDTVLPTDYITGTGKKVSIYYFLDKPPLIEVRMQEMYGQSQNPTVAQGKAIVTLSLLSPAMRPLQITQDLGAFWQGSYREIQKEMKGRYPKHLWPDDPANTTPTIQTKKAMQTKK